MNNYDDIINLPNPNPKKHKRLSMDARAAQFGAFRALTGHEDAIEETKRLTDERVILDESAIEELNEKINKLILSVSKRPEITIVFFQNDLVKDGGEYISYKGTIKKVDEYKRIITMEDKTEIKIDNILEISGEIFDEVY